MHGLEELARPKPGSHVASPFGADGLVMSYDYFETLLSWGVEKVHGENLAVMLAEAHHAPRASRESITELLFEGRGVPAMYLAKSAVLAAFANGRTSGLVLDIGYSGTAAVPVVEGALVKGKGLRVVNGGRMINGFLREQLAAEKVDLRMPGNFKRTVHKNEETGEVTQTVVDLEPPNLTDTWNDFRLLRLLEQVKVGICAVSENPAIDLVSGAIVPDSVYELPDGTKITMGNNKFSACEAALFSPMQFQKIGVTNDSRLSYVNPAAANNNSTGYSKGMAGLVMDAIHGLDGSLQRDMFAGVCLTGGSSNLPGLYERISQELLQRYNKARVLAATGRHERMFCTWTGGSILATFSEFQSKWFSKSEYEENGASFVHKKCP